MKLLFLIGDGMGDWPVTRLGGKTPLESAFTPHMDRLANSGTLGLCRTIPKGMEPGSDVANMSLLGYDPATHHTGRGPIEAAAQGLELGPDDLVWRMNLVTVSNLDDSGTMLDYSAGHIQTDEAVDLLDLLRKSCPDGIRLETGFQYRHLLVQKEGALRPEASLAIRPPHDILDQGIGPDLQMFRRIPTLWDLLHQAYELWATPSNTTRANAVWPWGQGQPVRLPSFETAFGLRGGVISAVDLVKGLGRAASMSVPDVPGATGLLDTNYEGKVQTALSLLAEHDFVYLHVEAPDECGHEGSLEKKIEAIARFDQRIVGPLCQALGSDDVHILVTCDHFTPLAKRTHTTDPVPFLLSRPSLPKTRSGGFSEKQAGLESFIDLPQGHQLLPWVLKTIRKTGSGGPT